MVGAVSLYLKKIPMKIIVFGANGRSGLQITARALEEGYEVTAFVRNPAKLPLSHPKLHIVQGDVNDLSALEKAIPGHEVLISALGVADYLSPAVSLMSDAMKKFLPIAEKAGVQKVFAIGGMGVLQATESTLIMDGPDFPAQYRNVSEGHKKVWETLAAGSIDWTFICCPNIIDGPETGKFKVRKDYFPNNRFEINTGDIAGFILGELEASEYPFCRLGICSILPQ